MPLPLQEGPAVKKSTWQTAALSVGIFAVSAVVLAATIPQTTLYVSGTTTRGVAVQSGVSIIAPTANNELLVQQALQLQQEPTVSVAPQTNQVGHQINLPHNTLSFCSTMLLVWLP